MRSVQLWCNLSLNLVLVGSHTTSNLLQDIRQLCLKLQKQSDSSVAFPFNPWLLRRSDAHFCGISEPELIQDFLSRKRSACRIVHYDREPLKRTVKTAPCLVYSPVCVSMELLEYNIEFPIMYYTLKELHTATGQYGK